MSVACLSPNNIEDSLIAIRESRKRKVVINVLLAFGDESSDEKAQRVFAVSAAIGTQEHWDLLSIKWESRTGGIPFHATDCDSNKGIYKKKPPKENKALYKNLVTILAESHLAGFGIALSLRDFREIFPGPVDNFEYYKCLSDLIASCANFTRISFPIEDTVKFTFDINAKTNFTAGEVYNSMINDEAWEFQRYLHPEELSFACRKTVGIQVADLIAREAMKRLDNWIGPTKYPSRSSYRKLADSGKFTFREYERSHLQAYKEMAEKLFRDHAEPYKQWLSNKGIQDNMAPRLRYMRTINYTSDG